MKKSNDSMGQNPVLDFVKNATLGSGVISVVTPLIYFKNMAQIKQKPVVRDCLRGVVLNGASYVPTSAVAMTINGMLLPDEATDMQKIILSVASGGLSGLVSCMPENVVQNMQASKYPVTAKEVIQRAARTNGYSVLWRGASAVMVREAMFAPLYLSLVPILSEKMNEYNPSHTVTNVLICSVIAGSVGGVMTTPLDVIRANKQRKITKKGDAPSVAKILRRVGWRGCFNGARPRSAAVIAATFLMTEGKRLMHDEETE